MHTFVGPKNMHRVINHIKLTPLLMSRSRISFCLIVLVADLSFMYVWICSNFTFTYISIASFAQAEVLCTVQNLQDLVNPGNAYSGLSRYPCTSYVVTVWYSPGDAQMERPPWKQIVSIFWNTLVPLHSRKKTGPPLQFNQYAISRENFIPSIQLKNGIANSPCSCLFPYILEVFVVQDPKSSIEPVRP